MKRNCTPTTLSAEVGSRIRHIREQRGLSQNALAERVNDTGLSIHQTQVSKVEGGTNAITIDLLHAFAVALDVTMADLLEETSTDVRPLPPTSEQIAQRLDARADMYPEFAFPENSKSPSARAAAAMRHAYRNAARIARGQHT